MFPAGSPLLSPLVAHRVVAGNNTTYETVYHPQAVPSFVTHAHSSSSPLIPREAGAPHPAMLLELYQDPLDECRVESLSVKPIWSSLPGLAVIRYREHLVSWMIGFAALILRRQMEMWKSTGEGAFTAKGNMHVAYYSSSSTPCRPVPIHPVGHPNLHQKGVPGSSHHRPHSFSLRHHLRSLSTKWKDTDPRLDRPSFLVDSDSVCYRRSRRYVRTRNRDGHCFPSLVIQVSADP